MRSCGPKFPVEIWEKIFDLLDTKSLQNVQKVCREWRNLLLGYIMNGRLGNRALYCRRLKLSTNFLEHKRRTWDTICLKSSKPVFLTGVGVFSPVGGESIVCVDARPIEKDLRPLDCCTKLKSEVGDESGKSITIFSKIPFHLEQNKWWEVAMHVGPSVRKYDPLNGGTIWSISGQDGERRIVVDDDLTIDFKMTEDRDVHWRSNITEGQLPYFLIWPL